MSRISGVVRLDGRPVELALLRKMVDASPARGELTVGCPSESVGVAHLRVHPGGGALHSPGDGKVWLAADVRLDDRGALASELRARQTLRADDPTDAELIVAAYDAWGVSCPQHLTGDFAFALWDGRRHRLLCARDQLGVKPLHYGRSAQSFVFGSEAVQVLAGPGIGPELDEMAWADHLVNDCRDEERTAFLHVRRLPPAHRLVLNGTGTVAVARYWEVDPDHRTRHGSTEEYVEHYRELFRGAVADRLRTAGRAVAIGTSGGLDSCSIAATAQRMRARPRLFAVSLSFDRLAMCDERAYSRLLRERLGLPITYCNAERVPLLAGAEDLRPDPETPFTPDASAHGDLLDLARDGDAAVYMTGHAGRYGLTGNRPAASADRLLEGDTTIIGELHRYAGAHSLNRASVIGRHLLVPLVPTPLRSAVRHGVVRPRSRSLPNWITADFASRTGLTGRSVEGELPVRRLARRRDYRRAVQLEAVGRAVYWYDRAAARRGMEARHPFLDRRLVEFLFAIPAGQVSGPGENRRILRRAMAGVLPDEIRLRNDKTTFFPRLRDGLVTHSPRIAAVVDERSVLHSLGVIDARRFADALLGLSEAPPSRLADIFFTVRLEEWLRHISAVSQTAAWPTRASQTTATRRRHPAASRTSLPR